MNEAINTKVEFIKALAKVQASVTTVKTDSTNPHFRNKYASLEAVNGAIMPELNKNGFVLLSGGVDIAGKPHLQIRLVHVSGYEISFDYPITDDGNPQHLAAAVTYARRYSLCALLNLNVEDDDGNTAAEGKTVTRKAADKPAPTAAELKARPNPYDTKPKGELLTYIPKKVEFVEGKGKGAGKTFSKITHPDGGVFDSNEMGGQIAQKAMEAKRPIAHTYETTQWGVSAGPIKMIPEDRTEAPETPEIILEETPF